MVQAANSSIQISSSAYLNAMPVGSKLLSCTVLIKQTYLGDKKNFFSVKGETSDGRIIFIKSWHAATLKLQNVKKFQVIYFEGLHTASSHKTTNQFSDFPFDLQFKDSSDFEVVGDCKPKLPQKLKSFEAGTNGLFCEVQCEMLGNFRNSMLGRRIDSCGVAVIDENANRAELFVKTTAIENFNFSDNSVLVVQATLEIHGKLIRLIAESIKDISAAPSTPKRRCSHRL